MKKNKKKLPKYWIGKRPIDPGYQINKGIGNATFNTTPGQSLAGEARAARLNILPQALGKLGLNAQYPMQMLLAWTPAVMSAKAAQSFSTAGLTLMNTATSPTQYLMGNALKTTGENVATKGSLSTLGKAAGVLGTAYGAYNVYNDIANSGPGLSLSDIANSSSVNTYTTDQGNTYTQHGGVDRSSILDYAKSERTGNLLGLTMDTAGLGASIGGFFGPLGMGIGAGAGLLFGGLASLLGFGDNEEEYKEMMRRQEDVFAMQDRQSEALAKDKDTKAEFYGRAANGKRPVWTPAGLVGKAATARVSNGEVVGNFEDGIATRIPGLKNNKDTKLAALKDGDFVITNKYGLSDYAAATGDYAGALDLLEMIMGMRNSKGYKNGKLPKHEDGMWGRIIPALSHLPGLASAISRLNDVKNAYTYAPYLKAENPYGAAAINNLPTKYDASSYYKEARDAWNHANFDMRRQVGLGQGGRMIGQALNFASYLNSAAKVNQIENEENNKLASLKANMMYNYGIADLNIAQQALVNQHQWRLQANQAKEFANDQWTKNVNTEILNAFSEYLKTGQYKDALAIQEAMLKLYERGVDLDEYKAGIKRDTKSPVVSYTGIPLSYLKKMITNAANPFVYPYIQSILNRTPQIKGFKNGKLPCHEDGLVDTRSDTTYKGYNPNPIPWGAGLGPAGQGPMALLEGLEAASKTSNNPYLLTGIAPSPNKTPMSLKTAIKNNKQRRDIEKVAKKVWTRTNKNKWAEQDAYEPNRYFTNKEHLYLKKKDPKLLLRLEDEAAYQWIMSSGPAAPTFYAPGIKFEDWYKGTELPINILQK